MEFSRTGKVIKGDINFLVLFFIFKTLGPIVIFSAI